MVKWLKRLWCWLTCGHRYADATLQCSYDEIEKSYKSRNHCAKCGALKEWEIPAELIDPPFMRNPFYLWREDGEDE